MMRYGLLVNSGAANIGDDIQSYAISRFMPRVDVLVNREKLDTFQYGDGTEPVAVLFAAWFMWHKHHWPPSQQIVPGLLGFHNYDRDPDVKARRQYALPIYAHHQFSGIGGQWMRDYGPVGCRDYYTRDILKKEGIDTFFSGCVTLTLPKQPKTKDRGKYIVLVDLNPKVEQKVRQLVGDRYEIRKLSHTIPELKNATWEERTAKVEEYLTIYQNAKYVVTRRLHVALPCLAMGTPVLVIQSLRMNDKNRFKPYKKWLHYCRNNTFLKEGYPDFDFENGTPNKTDYLVTRKKLIRRIRLFFKYCEENSDKPVSFFDKRSYTEEELNRWRIRFMLQALADAESEGKALYKLFTQEKPPLKKQFEAQLLSRVKYPHPDPDALPAEKLQSTAAQLSDILSVYTGTLRKLNDMVSNE